RPVNSINDIQGLKIRTGGGVAEAVAKAIGASAFGKPAPESYELLKSDVADGVFFPMESIISFKLETVLEQATLFPGGMYSSAFGFFMNEDKWNKLPKQDQEAIEKISGEWIARHAGRSWDDADQKGFDALKKSGVKIVNADAALVVEVKKRSAPIIDDWIQKASAKGVDAAKILAGRPRVSWADEHALMECVDRLLGARAQRGLERAVQLVCAAVMFLLTWLMWLKADRIWAYRDATDVLRIVYGPFVYFMAVTLGLAGVIHLYKIVERK